MAKKVQVLLVDDLDGSDAAETVTFGLDGVSYEIDLSADNAAKLRNALAAWIGHANRQGGRPVRSAKSARAGRRNVGDIRAWAKANGHKVSERGRIPAGVQTAYDEAHS